MYNLLSQLAVTYSSTGDYGCYVNGEPASCEQAGKIAAAVLIPLFLIFAVFAVFWVISLIHLVQHPDVPNRTLWIILHFVGLGPLAGIIYFFVVKRPYDSSHAGSGHVAPSAGPASGQPAQPPVVSPTPPDNGDNSNQTPPAS